IFLHKLKPGAADRSYGIQVAKLAGLPKAVTTRAAEVLLLLENSETKVADGEALLADLPLFAAARPRAPPSEAAAALRRAPARIRPGAPSPQSALETLYKLKHLVEKDPT